PARCATFLRNLQSGQAYHCEAYLMSIPQDRMDQLLKRFSMMETQMASNPDSETYVKLASEYSELEPVVFKIRDFLAARGEAADLQAMLDDSSTDRDMRELAEAELPEIEERMEGLETDIQVLLCQRMSPTSGTPFSKFVRGLAVRKRHCSAAIFSACTSVMP